MFPKNDISAIGSMVIWILLFSILFIILWQLTKLVRGKNKEDSHDSLLPFFTMQNQMFESYQNQLHQLKQDIFTQLNQISGDINDKLKDGEVTIDKQMDQIRFLVDDKLSKTLDERLGASFTLVQNSLSKVEQGLGEMQVLSKGVGDLKKVLGNVKTRGVLGEVQLGNIIDQLLSSHQYGKNVKPHPHRDNHVEYAIKMPDKNGKSVWLPVDAKFPLDKYEQLIVSYESGDKKEVERKAKALKQSVVLMARDIRDKYIHPPYTTDFGILFLPTEGLYAEVIRLEGLHDYLFHELKVMVCGPSNFAALLNSLQLGFRTIAIQERSAEVWEILTQVRTELGNFSIYLEKTEKKILEAHSAIEKAKGKTKTMETTLKNAEFQDGPSIPSQRGMPSLEINRQTSVSG